jgi:hypothetical protein
VTIAAKPRRLSPKEARAKLLDEGYDVTEKTVREWCHTQELRGAKKIQGRWHIPPSAVERICR